MGRLDDIIARNKKAIGADGPVHRSIDPQEPVDAGLAFDVISRLGGARFSLPSSQRTSPTAWSVILLMLVIGALFAIGNLVRASDAGQTGQTLVRP
ncbi:MAG: hypothetical protein AB7P03_14100 [Kofleriaceae bacterium]